MSPREGVGIVTAAADTVFYDGDEWVVEDGWTNDDPTIWSSDE